jgi:hypothetical protein
MNHSRRFRYSISAAFLIAMFAGLSTLQAADLNPAAIAFTMPDHIKWTTSPSGSSQAILAGDPSKPGLYIVLTKWSPNHMSRPHSHPNDRFITVISGTWWVGTGTTYDPALTTPMPPGSFVTHFGKQIHWDGAKDVECLLEIVGMGPAGSTSAEKKK